MAQTAAAQAGMVHRRQLNALGIGRGAIRHRRARGALHLALPSVFAVGHPGVTMRGRLLAALLYAGYDCVLSHEAAAWVWELAPALGPNVDLTIIRRHGRDAPGVRIHRAGGLDRSEVRLRGGLPVTAPARTLIDCAGRLDDGAAAALLAQARVNRIVTDRDLDAALELHPFRAGVSRIRRLRTGGPQLTRSEAERRLLALVSTAQLPVPEVNARLHGFEVDLLWRAQQLVVEFDGRQFHAHPAAFERDRRRDQVLLAAGYRVLRVTWRQLVDEPVALVVRIGQVLAAVSLAG